MTRQTRTGRKPRTPFSPEVREQAVRLVQEQPRAHASAMIAFRHQHRAHAAVVRVATLLVALATALPAQPAPRGVDALLPRAAHVASPASRAPFVLTPSVVLVVPSNAPPLRAVAVLFAAHLRARTGAVVRVTARPPRARDARYIVLDTGLDHRSAEAYELAVDSQRVVVRGAGVAGARWGMETLLQLLEPATGRNARRDRWQAAATRVTDAPAFAWRGSMIDAGRHFLPVRDIERHIDLLARYKMNVLHWHLTEDQGWRIEIPRYPNLTRIGAWRREADGSRYGGYYTQAQIRHVVRYAMARGITVVPEIEIPGHSSAAIASYPALGCTNDTIQVPHTWGVFADVYCAGKEETFTFLFHVLDEVIALFPSPYIHIGGDEAPKVRWKACAACQAVMQREGLANEEELQSWFLRRIAAHVATRGRRIIGWDEVLDGSYVPGGMVQSWRDTAFTRAAVTRDFDVIASPNAFTYLNRSAGELTLRDVYAFNPVPNGLRDAERARILGGEVPLWSEHIVSGANVDLMALPRLLAFAELLWSGPGGDYATFAQRVVKVHTPALSRAGYAIGPEASPLVSMRIVYDSITGTVRLQLPMLADGLAMRASTDGSPPSARSPVVRDGALLPLTGVTRLQAFWGTSPVREARHVEGVQHRAVGASVRSAPAADARYPGTGSRSLSDGLRGSTDHADGVWQGWSTPEVSFALTLPKPVRGAMLDARFLQNVRSWILLPREVTVSWSADGSTWSLPVVITHQVPLTREGAFAQSFVAQAPIDLDARHLRVVARSAILPPAHPGAGGAAWMFVDELVVRAPSDR
jgi:hexosaminidase